MLRSHINITLHMLTADCLCPDAGRGQRQTVVNWIDRCASVWPARPEGGAAGMQMRVSIGQIPVMPRRNGEFRIYVPAAPHSDGAMEQWCDGATADQFRQ